VILGEFKRLAKAALEQREREVAEANGRSTDRTLEQLRLEAGRAAGLREALAIVDQLTIAEDD
jgi:hypothetical protein